MISEWNRLNAYAAEEVIMRKLILASQSPRRQELLAMLGLPFEVLVSDTDETITQTDPAKAVEILSARKAEAVACQVTDAIIIGADTVVSVDEKILGKPKNKEEAREMITLLQGRRHMVYTGVTIQESKEGGQICTFSEGTRVNIAPMSQGEIESYIAGKEPYDKAGAYGIQGIFGKFIEGIEGDYYNVVGLPVHRLYEEMKKFSIVRLMASTLEKTQAGD